MTDNQFGANEIRMHVGDEVTLNDDVAQALEGLAEALAREAENAEEVSGFMFQGHSGDFVAMLPRPQMPRISGDIGDKPSVTVAGHCALDIVVTLPPKNG